MKIYSARKTQLSRKTSIKLSFSTRSSLFRFTTESTGTATPFKTMKANLTNKIRVAKTRRANLKSLMAHWRVPAMRKSSRWNKNRALMRRKRNLRRVRSLRKNKNENYLIVC